MKGTLAGNLALGAGMVQAFSLTHGHDSRFYVALHIRAFKVRLPQTIFGWFSACFNARLPYSLRHPIEIWAGDRPRGRPTSVAKASKTWASKVSENTRPCAVKAHSDTSKSRLALEKAGSSDPCCGIVVNLSHVWIFQY